MLISAKRHKHCQPRGRANETNVAIWYSSQGFFLPNLEAIGHSLSNLTCGWPWLTSAWPLTPYCIMFWSRILPTKSCSHGAFLSNSTTGWPLHDLRTQQCTTLMSRALPTKSGSHRVFLSNLTPGWPWMTPAWPSTLLQSRNLYILQ